MKSTVRIAVAFFAYGGNGGVSSMIPELTPWWAKTYFKLRSDPRVEFVHDGGIYSDTPIYMTRNRAVKDAQELGYDLLLMVDSDNQPDAYVGRDPTAEPFFGKPFDFVFERLKQGIPTVMMAPYCGPPPNPVPPLGVTDEGELPYLFQWTDNETGTANANWRQRMLTRNEAERLTGIYPVSCGPTGLSLWTLNAFDGPPHPYFDYEHDEYKTEKQGTEDCFATRNVSLYWKMTKGWDVCYAACDSWALHHKPKRVGKPKCATLEIVSEKLKEAILGGVSGSVGHQFVDYTAHLPRAGQILRHDQDQVYLSDEDLEHARLLVEKELNAHGA